MHTCSLLWSNNLSAHVILWKSFIFFCPSWGKAVLSQEKLTQMTKTLTRVLLQSWGSVTGINHSPRTLKRAACLARNQNERAGEKELQRQATLGLSEWVAEWTHKFLCYQTPETPDLAVTLPRLSPSASSPSSTTQPCGGWAFYPSQDIAWPLTLVLS